MPSFTSLFDDDFTRADSTTVGNGWVEDKDTTFAIVSNELVATGGGNFYNNIIRAPSSANFQDGKVVVEWTHTTSSLPQIFMRLDASLSNGLMMYWNSGAITLSRLVGATNTVLDSATAATTYGNRYRFTLEVSGNVKNGELYDITNGVIMATVTDSADTTYTASGYTGLSINTNGTVTYDLFESFVEGAVSGTITTPAIKNYSGTIQANGTGLIANIYSLTDGSLVLRKTGLTTDASGIMVINDALIIAATAYRVDIDDGTLFGNKDYTAT